jgi:hypothetical protein
MNVHTSEPAPDALPKSKDRSTVLAIAEGIILFGGLTLANELGYIDLAALPVHPFLFVVMLMGAQYGTIGGIVAAVAAGTLAINGNSLVRPIDQAYFDFIAAVWVHPLIWLAGGLLVGVVADRHLATLNRMRHELDSAKTAQAVISSHYEIMAERTRKLERRLAGLSEFGTAPATAKTSGKRIVSALQPKPTDVLLSRKSDGRLNGS